MSRLHGEAAPVVEGAVGNIPLSRYGSTLRAAHGLDTLVRRLYNNGMYSGHAPVSLPASGSRPSSSTLPLVRIEALSKQFGHAVVLDHIDLDVHAGEKITLIGPSGAGKSTLLRCVNYLERPTSGHVYLDGALVGERLVNGRYVPAGARELAATRRHIGMVFQHFYLFPHLTALQNVTLGLRKVLGLPKAEAEARAMALLTRVGLETKRDAYPDKLSGGQQQRVAIARALAMEPRVMLFDEATSALDPELAAEVLAVMRQLAGEGMTMMIVTHEMHFAGDVSDRVIFMAEGRLVEQGSPREVLKQPQHERTRRFLKAVIER